MDSTTTTKNDETEYSYVTYGMLHKHHEFVDWVRVDLGEDDKVKVQKANSNSTDSHHHHHDGVDNSFKDMDERAFEKFKTQWQEISAADADASFDATASPNASPTAASGGKSGATMKIKRKDGLRGPIKLGKKLLASASAKTLSPDSISYGVFDADWNPVKLTPRVSNVDVAILLHAANEEGKNSKQNSINNSSDDSDNTTNDSHKKRTYLTPEALDAGLANSEVKLPIVPVRRSTQQQFLIKQSVQLFFRKDSIEFFACFPLRYSPRTIYRFDMVHGGIDRTFWQKMKMKNAGDHHQKEKESKPTMNAKLIEMRSKVASNTANLQLTLASNTLELKNSLNTKVSTTRESILNLKKKKKLLSSNSKDNDGDDKTDDKAVEKTTKRPFKLGKMRFKMASAATMRSSFQSRVSTRKDSLFKMNKKTQSEDDATKDNIEVSETGDANADNEKAATKTMTTKLSQMKVRMSENTTSMKNNFATKVSTTKESLLKINKGGVAEGEGEATADANANADKKMPVKLSQMKLRMSGLLKKKKNDTTNTNAAVEGKEDEPTTTDLASNSTGDFSFTIDDEDDDDVNVDATSAAPTGASSTSPAGYVALSLDDAPCRFDDRSHSQLENVLDLLKRYDAKATFMVISSFLADCHEPDMIRLLQEGHELANHGVRDEPMDKMATSVDTFVEALEECNNKIIRLQKKAKATEIGVKWFRAPQSRYTKIMEEGLVVKDMHNVMCDAYAACPIVEDGPWIASTLSKQIKNGSVACLHMPEKCGFREHCLEAMEVLLEDLQKRNFKVVTIGELHKIAESLRVAKPGEDAGPKEDTIILL